MANRKPIVLIDSGNFSEFVTGEQLLVPGNVLPGSAGTWTLGSSSLPWLNLALGGASGSVTLVTSNPTSNYTATLVSTANSNTVIPLGGAVSNQWVTYIGADGTQHTSQPAFSNISGVATIAQGGTNNGSLDVTIGNVVYTDGSKLTTLAPSVSGYVLMTQGAGAAPIWVAQSGISNLTGSTGVVVQTGSTTYTARTITGTANQITIANGSGVSGNPTISLTTDTAIPGNPTTTTQSAGDNTTKVATTAFVTTAINNALTGTNTAKSVRLATAAVLPNSPTYANGSSGVGATLTAGSNIALTVDGVSVALNDRVLVKNQASTFQNGVYYQTQVGTGSVPWILTRALDFNTLTSINDTGMIPVTAGTANATTSWVLTSTVATIGTDALTFTQFSLAPSIIARINATNGFTANQLPDADLTRDLGAVATTWRNVYVKGITLAGSTSNPNLTIAGTGGSSQLTLTSTTSPSQIQLGLSGSLANLFVVYGSSSTITFQEFGGKLQFASQSGIKFSNLVATNPTADRTCTLPNADSNTVRGLGSGTTSNWVSYVGTDGVQNLTQPAFTDISGTATSGQLPATVAYTNAANNWTATQLPNADNSIDLGSTSFTWKNAYVKGISLVGSSSQPTLTVGNVTSATAPLLEVRCRQAPGNQAVLSVGHSGDGTNNVLNIAGSGGATLQFLDGNGQIIFNNLAGTFATTVTATTPTANRSCVLPNADSNTVRGLGSGTTSQWVRYVGTDGVQNLSQPAFTDISGTATSGQLPATVAYTNAANNWTVTQVPNTDNAIDLGSTSKTWANVYVKNISLLGNTNVPILNIGDSSNSTGAVLNLSYAAGNQAVITLGAQGISGVGDLYIYGTARTQITLGDGVGTINFKDTTNSFKSIISFTQPTADRTFTLPNANSNPVRPLGSQTANQWVAYIDSTGLQNTVQPAFTNISGTAGLAQGGTNADLSGATTGAILYKGSTAITTLTPTATALLGFNAAANAPEAIAITSTGGTVSFTRTAGSLNLEANTRPTISTQTASFTTSATVDTLYVCTGSTPLFTQTVTLQVSPANGLLLKIFNGGTGNLVVNVTSPDTFDVKTGFTTFTIPAPGPGALAGCLELYAYTGSWLIT